MIEMGVPMKALIRAWESIHSSGQFSEGQYVKKFENAVAEWAGWPVLDAVACNSAGTGLFMLLKAYVSKNVIVSNNTFFATGAMAREAGCNVTLADCGENDPSMTLESLKAAYNVSHDTVILTHVGGHLAKEYGEIAQFCREKGLTLIEDAAHVFGTKKVGMTAGALGDAAVFSFYPTKAVPVGEGGVIVSGSNSILEFCREYRNYGKCVMPGGKIVYGEGFNFRMDEWTAAVASLQVKRLDDILEQRREDVYKLMDVVSPLVDVDIEESNWYKYIAPACSGITKVTGKVYQVSDQLADALHMGGDFPNSKKWAESHICLPVGEGMYDNMTHSDLEKMFLGGSYANTAS